MRNLWNILFLCAIGAALSNWSTIVTWLPDSVRAQLPVAADSYAAPTAQFSAIQTTRTRLPAFTLNALDGASTLDSSNIRGQLGMVTFFAGWCGYCKAQMPLHVEMKRQYPGIRTIGVIYKDTPANAMAMLRAHGNPFDVVYMDPQGNAAKAMDISGVPSNYIVDADGNVRFHHAGAIMDTDDVSRFFIPLFDQIAQEKRRP